MENSLTKKGYFKEGNEISQDPGETMQPESRRKETWPSLDLAGRFVTCLWRAASKQPQGQNYLS